MSVGPGQGEGRAFEGRGGGGTDFPGIKIFLKVKFSLYL